MKLSNLYKVLAAILFTGVVSLGSIYVVLTRDGLLAKAEGL